MVIKESACDESLINSILICYIYVLIPLKDLVVGLKFDFTGIAIASITQQKIPQTYFML